MQPECNATEYPHSTPLGLLIVGPMAPAGAQHAVLLARVDSHPRNEVVLRQASWLDQKKNADWVPRRALGACTACALVLTFELNEKKK